MARPDQDHPPYGPGATWTTPKDGRRVIQLRGHHLASHEPGVWFANGNGVAWASDRAWERWVSKHGATFSHVDPDAVLPEYRRG